MTRTRVHARAYRGSAKVPLPERGSVTDGRTAASLHHAPFGGGLQAPLQRGARVGRGPSPHLSLHAALGCAIASRATSRGLRRRHRAVACARSVSTERGDAIEPETEPSGPFSRTIGESQPRAPRRPARARERAARGTPRERARDARDDPGTQSPRVPPLTTNPHPSLAAASRSSRPVRARRNERR